MKTLSLFYAIQNALQPLLAKSLPHRYRLMPATLPIKLFDIVVLVGIMVLIGLAVFLALLLRYDNAYLLRRS
jgi:hypothetical protein